MIVTLWYAVLATVLLLAGWHIWGWGGVFGIALILIICTRVTSSKDEEHPKGDE